MFQLTLHFVLATVLPVMYIGSSADLRDDLVSLLSFFISCVICVKAQPDVEGQQRQQVYAIADETTFQTTNDEEAR